MSENTISQITEDFYEKDYIEDEFGVGLKVYLGARFVLALICVFAALGALLCVVLGHIYPDEAISNFTGLGPAAIDANYFGLMVAGYAQVAYAFIGGFTSLWLLAKRNKLAAIVDVAAFVVFFAVALVMGGPALITDGAPCWILYVVLNGLWSFIALFAGKHFKYMPFK